MQTPRSPRVGPGDTFIGNYKLLQSIGEGHSGKVRLALHTITEELVAVKIVDKSKIEPAWVDKLVREVRIMKLLDHPGIVKLYEVIDNENMLYVFMEYAQGGELFEYLINNNGRLSEDAARRFFRQMLSAVDYCHSRNVVHRDLKAENVLLDKDFNVKIADFGFSNYFQPGNALATFCGSPDYCAPELFLRHAYEGPEVDVWALGVILYILVTGTMPFQDPVAVCEGRYNIPSSLTPDCQHLIRMMLTANRKVRPSVSDVMSYRWVNKGCAEPLRPITRRCPSRASQSNAPIPTANGANNPSFSISSPPSLASAAGGGTGDQRRYGAPVLDEEVLEIMDELGYATNEVQAALREEKCNTLTATYLLLCDRKSRSPEKHRAELHHIRQRHNPPPSPTRSSNSLNSSNSSHISTGAGEKHRGVTSSSSSSSMTTSRGRACSSPEEFDSSGANPRSPKSARRSSLLFFLGGGRSDRNNNNSNISSGNGEENLSVCGGVGAVSGGGNGGNGTGLEVEGEPESPRTRRKSPAGRTPSGLSMSSNASASTPATPKHRRSIFQLLSLSSDELGSGSGSGPASPNRIQRKSTGDHLEKSDAGGAGGGSGGSMDQLYAGSPVSPTRPMNLRNSAHGLVVRTTSGEDMTGDQAARRHRTSFRQPLSPGVNPEQEREREGVIQKIRNRALSLSRTFSLDSDGKNRANRRSTICSSTDGEDEGASSGAGIKTSAIATTNQTEAISAPRMNMGGVDGGHGRDGAEGREGGEGGEGSESEDEMVVGKISIAPVPTSKKKVKEVVGVVQGEMAVAANR